LCDDGYVAEGMLCVSDGTGSDWPPEAARWLGLTTPMFDAVSPDGQYVVYGNMTAIPEEPMKFMIGPLKIRDVVAGTDTTLVEAPVFVCGMGGCSPSDSFAWLDRTGWAIHYTYTSQGSMTEWMDMVTGAHGGFTLQQFERIVAVLPDGSGAISIKQTYQGNGGAVRYHPIPSGLAVTVSTTQNDPGWGDIVVTNVAGANYVAVHLGVAMQGYAQSLSIYTLPAMTAASVGEVRTNHMTFVGERLVYTDLDEQTVKSVPLAGTPIVSIAPGDWLSGSPGGTYVATRGTSLRVARTDGGAEAVEVPLTGVPSQVLWEDDSTLLFLIDRELSRWHVGDATATSLDTNVGSIRRLDDGLLVVAGGVAGSASVQLTDGAVAMGIALTSPVPAYVLRGSVATPLGSAMAWQGAGGTVLANRLYFDVLDGFAPDARNGTELMRP